MINQQQIKLVWVLARQIGIDEEELHRLILDAFGETSLKSLSSNQAKELIDKLIQSGGRVKKKRRRPKDLPANVVELVTRDQMRLVRALEKELGWNDNPDRLKGFTRRIIKADAVRTKEEGIKVIQGLKGMLKRSVEKQEGNKRQGGMT